MRLRVASLLARGRDVASTVASLREQVNDVRPSALLWLTDRPAAAEPLAQAMATWSEASVGALSQAGLIGGGLEHSGARDEVNAVALAISLPEGASCLPFSSEPDGLPEQLPWAEMAAAPPEQSPHLFLLAAPPRGASFPLERWLGMLDTALPWSKKVGGLVGGGRGGGLFMGATPHRGGAVGLSLQGVDLEARSFQGAIPIGPSYEITACEGNLIRELDHQPVGEVLGQTIEAFEATQRDEEGAGDGASLMCGISVPSRAASAAAAGVGDPRQGLGHEFVVRALLGFSSEHSVIAVGASPDLLSALGARLQLHSFSQAAARAEMQAGAATLRASPGGFMVSCLGRGEALYDEAGVESAILKAAPAAAEDDLALAGFFAGGEIGPVGARTFVHTFTTTVGLLRERKDSDRG